MFSDQTGDPHSPHGSGAGAWGQVRGFVHAHVGWLFGSDGTSARRFAHDMLRDRDVRVPQVRWPTAERLAACAGT